MNTRSMIVPTLAAAALCSLAGTASAQTFHQFIGSQNFQTQGWSIDSTPRDFGSITAGERRTGNVRSSHVIKYDWLGRIEWERATGTTNINNAAFSVQASRDGTYYVAGETTDAPGSFQQYVWKLTPAGAYVWGRALPGSAFSESEPAVSVRELPSNGDIVVTGRQLVQGAIRQNGRLTRLNAAGNVLWSRIYIDQRFPNNGAVSLNDVREAPDGRLYVIGHSRATVTGAANSAILLILDPAGNVLRALDYSLELDERGTAIELTPTAGLPFSLVWSGPSTVAQATGAKVVRVDPAGNPITSVVHPRMTPAHAALHIAPNNALILAGTGDIGAPLLSQSKLLLMTPNLAPVWRWAYGDAATQFGTDAAVARQGGYLLTGAWDVGGAAIPRALHHLKTDVNGSTRCDEVQLNIPPAQTGGFVEFPVVSTFLQGVEIYQPLLVDPVEIVRVRCICAADFNSDGTVDINDFFDFLTAYAANDPRADINSDGAVNINDFFDFLTLYSVGC